LFVYDTGLLYHNGKRVNIYASRKIHIKADDIHAMTPLSDYVILSICKIIIYCIKKIL